MLHQRHADATDHPADALAAGRLRVDDAARSVGADDAPDPRLAEIRIDCNFGQYSAERMRGESLALVAGLDIGRGLDRLPEALHGLEKVVRAGPSERVF